MKLEDILQAWKTDSEIDKTALDDEALKIPKLVGKYLEMLSNERLLLRKLESDAKRLRLKKFVMYTQGLSKEDVEAGETLPAKGMILKTEASMYVDADPDVQTLALRIDYAREKVETLDQIVKVVASRNFTLKTALDFLRFTHGG